MFYIIVLLSHTDLQALHRASVYERRKSLCHIARFWQSSKSSEELDLLRAEREALSRRQGERGGELERLRSEVDKAEQREKDEEDELKKLRDYQGQIKDMQVKRMQVWMLIDWHNVQMHFISHHELLVFDLATGTTGRNLSECGP